MPPTESLLVKLNSELKKAEEDYIKNSSNELSDLIKLINFIISNNEEFLRSPICKVCDKPVKDNDSELHHPSGWKHNPDIVLTVCKSCHQELSRRQMLWDKRWELADQTENVRNAFLLQGISDILMLRYVKLNEASALFLSNSLYYTISTLLGTDKHG